MKNTHRLVGVGAVAMMLVAGGCGSTPARPRAAASPGGSRGDTMIVLDGSIGEWPKEAAAIADEHYLYTRFMVQDQQFTIQSAPKSIALYFDTDADAATGLKSDKEPLKGMGVDLEVVFSPGKSVGGKGDGVMMWAIGADGKRTPAPITDFDFQAAPTFASDWYEARISRTPTDGHGLPQAGLLGPGHVKGVMALLDAKGAMEGWADPFTADTGAVCASGPALADAEPPLKPAKAVRVVSWNVEKSSPVKNPARFKRVLEALSPDIVLLQEWEEGDANALAGWFTAMVPRDTGWNVVKAPGDNSNGGGVAIVTRYSVQRSPIETLRVSEDGKQHAVRFVSARAMTPIGDICLGSTHLKCCGSAGSAEDAQRVEAAGAINAEMKGWTAKNAIRLIAGDMNLVGSRAPLDVLRAGLDGGRDLTVADAVTYGDLAYATWHDAATPFGPGRLDYLVYSASNAKVVHAFVLDTTRLTDGALARMGLDRDDTLKASDHMPVVVDLVAK